MFHQTTLQAASPDWFLARKSRITASISHKIWKGQKPETRLKYFTEDLLTNKNLQVNFAVSKSS